MKKEKSCSVIITRQEHGISRKLMNPNALRILYRLRDNGHVGYLGKNKGTERIRGQADYWGKNKGTG